MTTYTITCWNILLFNSKFSVKISKVPSGTIAGTIHMVLLHRKVELYIPCAVIDEADPIFYREKVYTRLTIGHPVI